MILRSGDDAFRLGFLSSAFLASGLLIDHMVLEHPGNALWISMVVRTSVAITCILAFLDRGPRWERAALSTTAVMISSRIIHHSNDLDKDLLFIWLHCGTMWVLFSFYVVRRRARKNVPRR